MVESPKTARRVVVGQNMDPAKAQRAKEFRRAMTRKEWILWEHLRGHGLLGLHFRRQQVIDGFIVDFYCHSANLVVEVDGPVHDDRTEYDLERDEILTRRGLQILRIRNEEITGNINAVLDRIASRLQPDNDSPDSTDPSLPSPRGGGAGGGVRHG